MTTVSIDANLQTKTNALVNKTDVPFARILPSARLWLDRKGSTPNARDSMSCPRVEVEGSSSQCKDMQVTPAEYKILELFQNDAYSNSGRSW